MINKQRIIAGFSLVLFFFTLSISFIPTKAAAKSDTLTATSQKYFKLQAFQRCIDGGSLNTPNLNLPPAGGSTPAKPTINGFAGFSGLIPKSIGTPFGDMDDSPIDVLPGDDFYWWPSEMGVSVGYSVAKDDGKWICSTSGHADEWFSLIGFKDFKDFREKYYKSYDDNLLTLKESRDKVVAELKNKINAAMPKLTNANLYQNFVLSFNKCAEQKSNKDEVIGTPIEVSGFVDIGGKQTDGTAYFQETEADQISVGHGVGASDGRFTCRTIATKLTALANDYFQYMKANPDEASDLASTANTSTTDNSCEGQGGVLSWLLCPVLNMVGSALNWVDTQLSRLLEIDRDKFTSDEMYTAWSRFRNIGLTLLIAAMLIMVIGTALGIEALDAYTVKKAFPRLVAAIVFVLLSWYICSFLIELSNVVGKGTLGLLTSPFGDKANALTSLFEPTAGGAGLQIGGLVLGGAALALPGAVGILLSWLGTGLLIMGIAFLVLIARQMFIIVLILVSPIAILSWIFPGNDKLWKIWWQSFSKLLLMFPIVMTLIASGRIFSSVIASTNSGSGEGLLNPLLKITAYVLPYAFIPFTFKAAGGIFGSLVGMANDRSKGVFDRLKKGRQSNYHRVGNDITSKRSELAANLGNKASGTGRIRGMALRGASRTVGAGNVEARMSAINKEQAQIINDQIATGRDDAIRGSTVALSAVKDFEKAKKAGLARLNNDGVTREYQTLGGGWVNEAAVMEGHARFKTQSQQQAALSYEMRKAATDEQVQGITQRYGALGADYGLSKRQTDGMWIGAAFENQNQHLAFKHTKFDENGVASVNGAGLASEAYEKKGTYALSQMSAETINQLGRSYVEARDTLTSKPDVNGSHDKARRTMQEITAVSEAFMQRGAYGAASGGDPSTPEGVVRPTSVPGAAGATPGTYFSANSQGSGSVAEAVVGLTQITGVYNGEINNPKTPSSHTAIYTKPQN